MQHRSAASALCSDWKVQHQQCAATKRCSISTVQRLDGAASATGQHQRLDNAASQCSISTVQRLESAASALCSDWTVQHQHCAASALCSISDWTVQHCSAASALCND